MKALFGALWVGDRFNAYGNLWTRLDHRTARQHSPESIKLGERGGGYIGDTICSFEKDEVVEFVPPAAGVAASRLPWDAQPGCHSCGRAVGAPCTDPEGCQNPPAPRGVKEDQRG